jgi:hypothetical protein
VIQWQAAHMGTAHDKLDQSVTFIHRTGPCFIGMR